jgi:hypothetical protein
VGVIDAVLVTVTVVAAGVAVWSLISVRKEAKRIDKKYLEYPEEVRQIKQEYREYHESKKESLYPFPPAPPAPKSSIYEEIKQKNDDYLSYTNHSEEYDY